MALFRDSTRERGAHIDLENEFEISISGELHWRQSYWPLWSRASNFPSARFRSEKIVSLGQPSGTVFLIRRMVYSNLAVQIVTNEKEHAGEQLRESRAANFFQNATKS